MTVAAALPAPDLSAFGAWRALAPLPGGARSQAWQVVGPDGQPGVAKPAVGDPLALDWLVPLQAAARAAGFIVPDLIDAPDGRRIAQGWTIQTWIAGRAPLAPQMATLKPMVQAMHRLAGPVPQRPGQVSVRDLIGAGRGGVVDMAALPAPLAAACRAAWARLTGAECAIHGDLHPGNVILTAQGPALIDWDEARRDLSIFDLMACQTPTPVQTRAHLAWEVACGWHAEPARARSLAARLLAQDA